MSADEAQALEDEGELEDGWQRIEDEDGDVYFYHEASGESRWEILTLTLTLTLILTLTLTSPTPTPNLVLPITPTRWEAPLKNGAGRGSGSVSRCSAITISSEPTAMPPPPAYTSKESSVEMMAE